MEMNRNFVYLPIFCKKMYFLHRNIYLNFHVAWANEFLWLIVLNRFQLKRNYQQLAVWNVIILLDNFIQSLNNTSKRLHWLFVLENELVEKRGNSRIQFCSQTYLAGSMLDLTFSIRSIGKFNPEIGNSFWQKTKMINYASD